MLVSNTPTVSNIPDVPCREMASDVTYNVCLVSINLNLFIWTLEKSEKPLLIEAKLHHVHEKPVYFSTMVCIVL